MWVEIGAEEKGAKRDEVVEEAEEEEEEGGEDESIVEGKSEGGE